MIRGSILLLCANYWSKHKEWLANSIDICANQRANKNGGTNQNSNKNGGIYFDCAMTVSQSANFLSATWGNPQHNKLSKAANSPLSPPFAWTDSDVSRAYIPLSPLHDNPCSSRVHLQPNGFKIWSRRSSAIMSRSLLRSVISNNFGKRVNHLSRLPSLHDRLHFFLTITCFDIGL